MTPRILHQVWLGGSPPDFVVDMMNTVKSRHGHWEYRLWTDNDVPRLENAELFHAASSPAMKADILRYELLHAHGGVYLDADFRCHRAVDLLFPSDASLRLVSEFGVVCNGVMASSPGHPFIGLVIRELGKLSPDDLNRPPHLVTGPYFLDSLFIREKLAETDPGVLLPGDYFFPPRTRVKRTLDEAFRKRFLTHEAMASWREKGLQETLRRTKLRTRTRRFFDLSAE